MNEAIDNLKKVLIQVDGELLDTSLLPDIVTLEFIQAVADRMGCKIWIEEQKPPEQEGTWRTRPGML